MLKSSLESCWEFLIESETQTWVQVHKKLEQAIELSEEKDKLLLGAVHYIYACVFVFVLNLVF